MILNKYFSKFIFLLFTYLLMVYYPNFKYIIKIRLVLYLFIFFLIKIYFTLLLLITTNLFYELLLQLTSNYI